MRLPVPLVDFMTGMYAVQAVLADLTASPIKSVVNISSSSGTLHLSGQSVYGMTKSALNYLTKTLAGELAPAGIRVLLACVSNLRELTTDLASLSANTGRLAF